MNKMPELVRQMQSAVDRQADKAKPTAFDTTAVVTRVEGNTAWVHFDGGADETPVELTIATKPGDTVKVRVSGGNAWLQGNSTAPPTDDSRANESYALAEVADGAARNALENAKVARDAAESAQAHAAEAEQAAEDAQGAADAAQGSAESAQNSATTALSQLDIIENVVGVLDLLSKNGSYDLTTDTEVQPNKWYFVRTGTSPDYVYQVVSNPSGDPSAQNYYELVGIDQAVQKYVSSHLALDDGGLWLQTDGSNAKLRITSSAIILYGADGTPIAKYGSDTIIGDENGFHIQIGGANNEIGFYQGTNRVAYMSGSELYVENSLSFGHFIFYERSNGHFTLKRVH